MELTEEDIEFFETFMQIAYEANPDKTEKEVDDAFFGD